MIYTNISNAQVVRTDITARAAKYSFELDVPLVPAGEKWFNGLNILDVYKRQALNYYRGGATISDEDMEAYRTGQKGIDWQEKMLQTGVSQNYKVSISGCLLYTSRYAVQAQPDRGQLRCD